MVSLYSTKKRLTWLRQAMVKDAYLHTGTIQKAQPSARKKKKKTQEDSSKNGIMQLLQDQSGTICYIPLWLLLLTAEGKKKTRRCHEHGASGKTGALYHNGGRISRCSLCWVYKLSTLKQTRNNSLVSKASTETSVPLSANYAYRLSKSHRRNFHQCKMCR